MRIYCDVLGRTAQERKQTKIFESKKMTDHILAITGLWLFCDYCYKKNNAKIKLLMLNEASFLRSKTTFKLSINSYFSGVMHGADSCMGQTPPKVLTISTQR